MARTAARAALPEWIRPQLTQLVQQAPEGDQWLHEIKYHGFRMHARLDHGEVRLLTRNGLNWTGKYPQIATAVSSLPGARQAYLDGELCGVRPDGVTSFSMMRNPTERARRRQPCLFRVPSAARGRSEPPDAAAVGGPQGETQHADQGEEQCSRAFLVEGLCPKTNDDNFIITAVRSISE
jgi:ATP dependent DNA ligase domain